MKKLMPLLLLTGSILLMLSSICMAGPKYGGTLVFATNAGVNQVDPHRAFTAPDGRAASYYTETLVFTGPNFEIKPLLAKSWDISENGLTYTFHLRKGVKFHNGREMTAKDVKFSYDRIMNPKTRAAAGFNMKNVKSVEVIDPYTVKITLKKPNGAFLSTGCSVGGQLAIIAEECVPEDGKITHPIGTGPFKFVEWKHGEYLKVAKFKDYWQKGIPYLDEVIVKMVPDPTVQFAALKTGEVDIIADLELYKAKGLLKQPEKGIQLMKRGELTLMLHFNCSKPPFNDVRVRQAVAYAINREELVTAIWEEFGDPREQFFSEDSIWYLDIPQRKRDIAKAKSLLKEAGYPDGFEVALDVCSTYPAMKMEAEVLEQQLRKIGIKVKPIVQDWPTHARKAFKGNFQLMAAGYGRIADPHFVYHGCFSTKGFYHFLTGRGYKNPKVDELLEKAAEPLDVEKRKAYYTEALKIIMEEAPIVWGGSGVHFIGARSYVKGFEPHIYGMPVYVGGGFQHTWLDK